MSILILLVCVGSGTNAMGKYLMNNLVIPENEGIGHGILAQVPWHKHGMCWYGSRLLLESYYFTGHKLTRALFQAGWI